MLSYAKKHPMFNSLIHITTGLGLGVLLARPLFATHPVRYGGALLALGLIGLFYACTRK
jgi:hypothetical protein